jgi:hypothetical protein
LEIVLHFELLSGEALEGDTVVGKEGGREGGRVGGGQADNGD